MASLDELYRRVRPGVPLELARMILDEDLIEPYKTGVLTADEVKRLQADMRKRVDDYDRAQGYDVEEPIPHSTPYEPEWDDDEDQ